MKKALEYIRQSQWRWDYAVASHGSSFHAPIEYQRIMALSLDRAHKARFEIAKVLSQLGYNGNVPLPDISTKQKAQQYIGLDIPAERNAKKKFMDTVVPQWLKQAQSKKRLLSVK